MTNYSELIPVRPAMTLSLLTICGSPRLPTWPGSRARPGIRQEIRRYKPSTVSRRFSVVAGFYRTALIDGC